MADKTNKKFNWFQIFKSGTQTDSKGKTLSFTNADLDAVVSNFKPQTAPLVVGHPTNDDPAWGWTSELKREGDVLYAKAEDVAADFAEAVENKRYPNRSVRLTKTDAGYQLAHIGFLGAKPPAVGGLQWQFNADDETAMSFEFSASDRIETVSLDTANVLVRLMTNMRTFIADKFDTETAEKVIPSIQATGSRKKRRLLPTSVTRSAGTMPSLPSPMTTIPINLLTRTPP